MTPSQAGSSLEDAEGLTEGVIRSLAFENSTAVIDR